SAPSTIPYDEYDFPGWTLQTLDGTQYVITRENYGEIYTPISGLNAYGPAQLSQIIEPSGDMIQIGSSGIQHYVGSNGITTTNLTRSVYGTRNAQGLISALYDPNSGVTDPSSINPSILPTVQYVYDNNLNLVQVMELVN